MAELKNTSRLAESSTNNSPDEPKGQSSSHSLIPPLTVIAGQLLTPVQKSVLSSLDHDNNIVKNTVDDNGNTQDNLIQIKMSKPGNLKSESEEEAHPQDENEKISSSNVQNTRAKEEVSQSKEKIFIDQAVQTEQPKLNCVTEDAGRIVNPQKLAETLSEALEEASSENLELLEECEKLQEKAKTLEKENEVLLQLLDADKLKGFYDAVIDDMNVAGAGERGE